MSDESYPESWKHATIHLNPETGELHSDGDHSVKHWIADALEQKDKRITELEAASTYLSAEVKDAWDQGRLSIDTFHAALAMDKTLVTKVFKDTT